MATVHLFSQQQPMPPKISGVNWLAVHGPSTEFGIPDGTFGWVDDRDFCTDPVYDIILDWKTNTVKVGDAHVLSFPKRNDKMLYDMVLELRKLDLPDGTIRYSDNAFGADFRIAGYYRSLYALAALMQKEELKVVGDRPLMTRKQHDALKLLPLSLAAYNDTVHFKTRGVLSQNGWVEEIDGTVKLSASVPDLNSITFDEEGPKASSAHLKALSLVLGGKLRAFENLPQRVRDAVVERGWAILHNGIPSLTDAGLDLVEQNPVEAVDRSPQPREPKAVTLSVKQIEGLSAAKNGNQRRWDDLNGKTKNFLLEREWVVITGGTPKLTPRGEELHDAAQAD